LERKFTQPVLAIDVRSDATFPRVAAEKNEWNSIGFTSNFIYTNLYLFEQKPNFHWVLSSTKSRQTYAHCLLNLYN
jgi:hypothetical protein